MAGGAEFRQEPFPVLSAGASSLSSGATELVSPHVDTPLVPLSLLYGAPCPWSARTFGRHCPVTQSSQTHVVPGTRWVMPLS